MAALFDLCVELDGFVLRVAEEEDTSFLQSFFGCARSGALWSAEVMEAFGKSTVSGPANVIYLSTILGRDWPVPVHKCDWKCENEHVCGNMYLCKLTGLTHICDKNCNQRILYDNHNSMCLASRRIFPLSAAEEQAVRGVRRKLDADSSPSEPCAFKRRRDAQFHPSPFERSFSAVSPICSQVGDGMDLS